MKDSNISDLLTKRTGRPVAGSGIGLVAATAALSFIAAGLAARRPDPHPRGLAKRAPAKREALRLSRDGAAIMGSSVLLDSALEHLRGDFRRDEMYIAPLAGAASMAAAMAEPRQNAAGRALEGVHIASFTTGLMGMGFHLGNVLRRPGGISWNNLFYAAPLGAPGALIMSGLIGMVTHQMARSSGRERRHGRQLAALTATAMLAETAEVALLHFRGAYHDPAMYLPATLPPVAAVGLLAESLSPRKRRRGPLKLLLRAVEALGYIGTAFHALGVARNSGGWKNWRQTTLAGPPMPAPISFAGLGKSGRAALDLLDVAEDREGGRAR
ncbi:hypothetical protein U879_20920 [Defluviimonas sp. 20V17]|nr:hypothetical protein [Allgaiera indica]KDB01721.1 hypothetical protein U879_20920 [Defluviimonas sp. 20V17]SDX33406.1 hypothetical protein SAMN05444006_1146 [Allgaiera indica]